MHMADLIALVVPVLMVGGSTVAAIVKLTRLIDAVNRTGAAIEKIAEKVDNHEIRLHDLERDRSGEKVGGQ